jgi:hypothetical protein
MSYWNFCHLLQVVFKKPMDEDIISVMQQQFSTSLVCGLLQQLSPESSKCKLLTLEALYFLTSLWKTGDISIIGSCYKKAGFGCGVVED